MNNLFHAFTIEIPGQLVDDKRFYEYSDFDNENLTTPTAEEILVKAKAYTMTQQIKRKLSEYVVPVYFTVEYSTEGTCSTVPTDAKLTVGYITYEPFVSVSTDTSSALDTEKAAAVIKEVIDSTFEGGLEQELAVLQSIVTVPESALIDAPDDTFRNLYMDYIDVESETVSSTVTYISL